MSLSGLIATLDISLNAARPLEDTGQITRGPMGALASAENTRETRGTKMTEDVTMQDIEADATEPADPSRTVKYDPNWKPKPRTFNGRPNKLKMPSGDQLLRVRFEERRYLLRPWLREHEACMLYAATGIGKSWFALSAAMAIAGNGEFLGWTPDGAPSGKGWRVLYVDGEMHAGDIQERYRRLRDGMKSIDKAALDRNFNLLARTHQEPGTQFPSITEEAGRSFVLYQLQERKFDVVVLDNFSTLGEVEDENAASSFNAIQDFLLQLKAAQVATILVHHANKAEHSFRGSSKLAATFEVIVQLERPEAAHKNNRRALGHRVAVETGKACFRVIWDKMRSGDVRPKSIIASLEKGEEKFGDDPPLRWDYFETGTGLDELAELIPAGQFVSQKEIGTYCDVHPVSAGRYVKKLVAWGLLTEEDISRGFALGKKLRAQGKTLPPEKPDNSWKEEILTEEETTEAMETKPTNGAAAGYETEADIKF